MLQVELGKLKVCYANMYLYIKGNEFGVRLVLVFDLIMQKSAFRDQILP